MLGFVQTLQSEEIHINRIVEGCKKGDPKSQEQLYRHFYAKSLKISFRYAKNEEDAVEILNDAFLKVFSNIEAVNKISSIWSWIRSIVIHTAIDRYKKVNAKMEMVPLEKVDNEESDIEALKRLESEEILKLVQSLPATQRLVFNLYVVEGYSHKEIANKLKITDGSSRSYLSEANGKLRQMIMKKSKVSY